MLTPTSAFATSTGQQIKGASRHEGAFVVLAVPRQNSQVGLSPGDLLQGPKNEQFMIVEANLSGAGFRWAQRTELTLAKIDSLATIRSADGATILSANVTCSVGRHVRQQDDSSPDRVATLTRRELLLPRGAARLKQIIDFGGPSPGRVINVDSLSFPQHDVVIVQH